MRRCIITLVAWTPECVVHDTDPLKFTEFHLFPPDEQCEGNSSINVLTYISHICLKSDCNSTLPFEFPICLPLPVSHPCTSFPLATFKLCIVWFAHRTCYICVIFVFSGFKPSLIRKSQEVVSKNKWIGLDCVFWCVSSNCLPEMMHSRNPIQSIYSFKQPLEIF